MEITGRFIQHLPEQRGETARGPWVRGGFVIETDGEYPRKIAFTSFGEDRIAMAKDFQAGTPVTVTFSLESREYPAGANRWFTDARCIRIQPSMATAPMPPQSNGYTSNNNWNAGGQQPAQPTNQTPFAAAPTSAMGGDDDLPF